MTDDPPDATESNSNDDQIDPELPPEPDDAEEGGPALSPEELDIADSEYVEPLDDSGRYVVSPGGGPPNVPDWVSESGESDDRSGRAGGGDESGPTRGGQPTGGMRSPESARTLLAEELKRSKARYGIDVVARFDGDTARHRTASDDVVATFENLVRWYARHVSDGTPADEVVQILLREASFTDGGTETPNLAKLLKAHDLEGSDSIDDLVAAIREESDRN